MPKLAAKLTRERSSGFFGGLFGGGGRRLDGSGEDLDRGADLEDDDDSEDGEDDAQAKVKKQEEQAAR